MPGTQTDAALALTSHLAEDYTYLFSANGSSRMVYLINDVIYKVEGIAGTNETEFDTILNGPSLPNGVFYPDVELFYILDEAVIAMEYVEGDAIYSCWCADSGDVCDSVCMTPQEFDFLSPLLCDPSGQNVIRNIEGYYIIDAA